MKKFECQVWLKNGKTIKVIIDANDSVSARKNAEAQYADAKTVFVGREIK